MPATGRYQSRFFNFLNRQSRKLIDSSDRTLRQVKVAVTWAAQVVAYPVYLLFQTTRLTGKQFKQTVDQKLPQISATPETPPEVDSPIIQVLETAASFESLQVSPPQLPSLPRAWDFLVQSVAKIQHRTPQPQSQTLTTQHLAIRGIATELSTKALVLVTLDNQLLRLTPEQQHQLAQKIIFEIANFNLICKQLAIQPPQPLTPLEPLANRDNLLPPVRWFWQIMAWVQTSPVAIAINLFGESRLTQIEPPTLSSIKAPVLSELSLTKPNPLTSFDQSLAIWEENYLMPLSVKTAKLLQQLPPNVSAQIEKMSQKIIQSATRKKADLDSSEPSQVDSSSPRIQALILAAIHYFFGRTQTQVITTSDYEWNPDFFDPVVPKTSLTTDETQPPESIPETPPAISASPKFQEAWLKFIPFRSGEATETTTPALPVELPSPLVQAAPVPSEELLRDYWLDMEDLFGIPQQDFQPVVTSAASGLLPPGESIVAPQEPLEIVISRSLTESRPHQNSPQKPQKTARNRSKLSADSLELIPELPPCATPVQRPKTQPSPSLVKSHRSVESSIEQAAQADAGQQPEYVPDWLEAQVTSVGYKRSLLQQLLNWCDQSMLKIEEGLINLGRWIKQLLQSIFHRNSL